MLDIVYFVNVELLDVFFEVVLDFLGVFEIV